jgi:hypothetical protein
MDFLKSVGGKVITGVVALAVVVGAISWFRMEEGARSEVLGAAGKMLGWMMIVLLVPWATFFIIGRVGRLGSNLAGAALVAGYTLIEFLLLWWMFNWSIHGTGGWAAVLVGILFAAVYNVLACDWIAEKVEG